MPDPTAAAPNGQTPVPVPAAGGGPLPAGLVEAHVAAVSAAARPPVLSDADLESMAQAIPPEYRERMRDKIQSTIQSVPLASNGASVAAPAPAPVTPAAAPSTPAVPIASEPTPPPQPQGPALPGKDRPANFMAMPEAIFQWTPEASGGHPLCGLLVRGSDHAVDTREKIPRIQFGKLHFFLMAPAYALTRDGQRVLLAAGRYVVVHLYDGLVPLVTVANHLAGMVNVRILPLDTTPLEGGALLHHFDTAWERSPDKPEQAKLYPRELLQKKG